MRADATRQALLNTIDAGAAHMSFDELIDRFPLDHVDTRVPNVPYSFWALLEHVRICIVASLDYAFSETYRPLAWPAEFWPDPDEAATPELWERTIDGIRTGIAELRRIAADPSIDLDAVARNAGERTDRTIVFELIDALDHMAYHFGEFAILRQVAGLWPADRTG